MIKGAFTLAEQLIEAAENIDLVSATGRANLLVKAAVTLADLRERIAFSEAPDGAADVVQAWRQMARTILDHDDEAIADALREASVTVSTAAILLDCKYEVMVEDSGPEGRA